MIFNNLNITWWACIMHQPLTLTYKERVRHVNREIIHLLSFVDIPFQPDKFIIFIRLADVHAWLQFISRQPACFFRIEGMLRCSLYPLAVDDEMGKDFVRM